MAFYKNKKKTCANVLQTSVLFWVVQIRLKKIKHVLMSLLERRAGLFQSSMSANDWLLNFCFAPHIVVCNLLSCTANR